MKINCIVSAPRLCRDVTMDMVKQREMRLCYLSGNEIYIRKASWVGAVCLPLFKMLLIYTVKKKQSLLLPHVDRQMHTCGHSKLLIITKQISLLTDFPLHFNPEYLLPATPHAQIVTCKENIFTLIDYFFLRLHSSLDLQPKLHTVPSCTMFDMLVVISIH